MGAASSDQEVALQTMAQHLTPTELASLMGMDRSDVIATCVVTGVPIFHGRIDKSLFAATIREQPIPAETIAAGQH